MSHLTPELLARIPLLQGLEENLLNELSKLMQIKELAKRDNLMHKGDEARELFFLLEGRLLVVDVSPEGRQTGLNFIEPGDFLGELAVIDELPRSATVLAIAPSKVAALSKQLARKLLFGHPLIAERMLKHISLKLRASTDYRAILGIPNAFQRIFSLMELLGKPDPGKLITIENMPTHEQIALMVNTSRETVTRAMQILNDEKVVEKDNRRLIIRFPDKLHVIIQRVSQDQQDK